MTETIHVPVLEIGYYQEIGYYHPTWRFLNTREHISVMDTSKHVPGGDGELVALFGLSQSGGATEEEAAESRRQAQLFISAPKLLAAVKSARNALQDAQGEWSAVSDAHAPLWTHPLKQEADALAEVIASVEAESL